jgi:hypothetical protein
MFEKEERRPTIQANDYFNHRMEDYAYEEAKVEQEIEAKEIPYKDFTKQ